MQLHRQGTCYIQREFQVPEASSKSGNIYPLDPGQAFADPKGLLRPACAPLVAQILVESSPRRVIGT